MARRLAASPEPKLTSIKRKAVVISSETTSEADSGHDDDDEDVFVVERIVRSKVENGDKLYEIKWQGYDSDENTWEPAEVHSASRSPPSTCSLNPSLFRRI